MVVHRNYRITRVSFKTDLVAQLKKFVNLASPRIGSLECPAFAFYYEIRGHSRMKTSGQCKYFQSI